MRRPRFRLWTLLVAVAIAGLILGLAAMSIPRRRPFDPIAWRMGREHPTRDLQEMADDLIATGKLLGKTRQEVIRLLGEPFGETRGKRFGYYLGGARGTIGPDIEVLDLLLGPE